MTGKGVPLVPQPWRAIGLTLSVIVAVFLVLDGAMKLVPIPQVVSTMASLGWPSDAAGLRTLGALLLAATALYAWPRTSTLGAILLTAYLGGSVAANVRVANPLWSHDLFGVYLGVALWFGLWCRNPSLRSVLPWRSTGRPVPEGSAAQEEKA